MPFFKSGSLAGIFQIVSKTAHHAWCEARWKEKLCGVSQFVCVSSLCVILSIRVSLCLYLCISVSVSLCLSLPLSPCGWVCSVYVCSLSLSIYFCSYVSASLCVSVFVFLSMCLCLCLYVCVLVHLHAESDTGCLLQSLPILFFEVSPLPESRASQCDQLADQ